jgi:hypothetical protein
LLTTKDSSKARLLFCFITLSGPLFNHQIRVTTEVL